MCGIAGIHILNPENAPKYSKIEYAIDTLLAAIDHRGGDATGFVAIGDDGQVAWQKASCNAYDFYKERRSVPAGVRSILCHTRMATQGSAAFPENNHPVRRGSVYVVHNGHIWNDAEVFRKTERTRYGQVDSEAIAAVISKYGIDRTHKAMEEIAGAAAIGVVDENKPGYMVLARGASSPLMFYKNDNVAVFASTVDAVKRAWKMLYGTSPKDNKIMAVSEGTAIYLEDSEIHTERFIPDDYYYSSKNNGSVYYGGHYGGYYTVNGQKVGNSWDDGWDDDYKEPKVTIVGMEMGELCEHGCEEEECDICNPDDELGSFLPALTSTDRPVISDGSGKGWLEAAKCELCDLWFAENELSVVKDWEDDWMFCKTCLEEMSEVLDTTSSSYPLRIHGELIDEDAAISWLSADSLDYV